ncbi:universal stress protein [Pseudonocardia acaciae]|uniref:universal stress protein n=1 Tax=Pseudonocardia acaciae TaxID=551276 RepID=UPI0005645D54|nr:universal stress protein [Pseudonocardia acaciae]
MDSCVRRVIVGVGGSAGSLRALRRAVTEARLRDAELWSVLAWIPQGGEIFNRRHPCPPLLGLWERDALRRLHVAWEEALGGVPAGLAVCIRVGRGAPGQVLVRCADRDDDLLVVGGPGPVRRLLGGSVAGHCLRRARCGVLVVPPPRPGSGALGRTLAVRRIVRDLERHPGRR